MEPCATPHFLPDFSTRRRTGIEPAWELSPPHGFEGISGLLAALSPVTWTLSSAVVPKRAKSCQADPARATSVKVV